MSADAPAATAIKQIIPGYRLERKIGQGGMGAVFLATQLSMERPVAVKILPRRIADKPGFRERFLREARAAGALNHPNIVLAIDCQETPEGYCYLTMEYVDGHDPLVAVRRDGPMPERAAAAVGAQIARGLAHAWKAGLVHRDVKPENILVTADGTAKLCDLGIAQFSGGGDDTGAKGLAVGTPRYMSPEQAQGLPTVDFRTDIYSLGASLYHLMTGQSPFTGANSAELMRQQVHAPLVPPIDRHPRLTRNASRVIEKMMAKNPDDRYATAEALAADLEAIAKGRIPPGVLPAAAVVAPVAGGAARRTRARRGGGGAKIFVGLAGLALAVAAYYLFRRAPAAPVGPPPVHNPRAEIEAEAQRALDAVEAVAHPDHVSHAAALAKVVARFPDTRAAQAAAGQLARLRAAMTAQTDPAPPDTPPDPPAPANGDAPPPPTDPGKGDPASQEAGQPVAPPAPGPTREERAEREYFELQQRLLSEKPPAMAAERQLREFAHAYEDVPHFATLARQYARDYAKGAPPPPNPTESFDRMPPLEQLRLLDAVIEGLESDDPKAALDALATLRTRQVPANRIGRGIAAGIERHAAEGGDAALRAEAVGALSRVDPARGVPALVKALDDANDTVRLAAVRGLARRIPQAGRQKDLAARLRAMTEGDGPRPADPSPEVRTQAVALLARLPR